MRALAIFICCSVLQQGSKNKTALLCGVSAGCILLQLFTGIIVLHMPLWASSIASEQIVSVKLHSVGVLKK